VSPLKLQAKDREQGSGSWPKQGSGWYFQDEMVSAACRISCCSSPKYVQRAFFLRDLPPKLQAKDREQRPESWKKKKNKDLNDTFQD
jgi:hypothetical protein